MFPFITMCLVYFATAPAIDWIYKIGFVEFIFDSRYYRKVINTLGNIVFLIYYNIQEALTDVFVEFSA